MAIKPDVLYPGKITPASSQYPYGKARNVSTPGDGTGTPWEENIVNDIFGFQQAILDAGSVIPSGTPDYVGASQYLTALQNVVNLVRATIEGVTWNNGTTKVRMAIGANDGGLVMSDDTFAGGTAEVSDRGGISLKTNDHGISSARIVKTIDDTTFAQVFEILSCDSGLTVQTRLTKTISSVNTGTDELTIAGHGLVTAQRVTFVSSATDPTPLVTSTRYYVIVVDSNTVKLATTAANAIAGTAIDISTTGSGTLVLETGSPVGSFTLGAAASLVINNPAVNSGSIILLTPTNASAATLQAGTSGLYVTATNGSFTVSTADAGSAAGTETFNYMVIN